VPNTLRWRDDLRTALHRAENPPAAALNEMLALVTTMLVSWKAVIAGLMTIG
jgi:hypothetical protein